MPAELITIKIVKQNKKIIHLALPIFCISIILFLLPNSIIKNYQNNKHELKNTLKKLKQKGQGTKMIFQKKEHQIILNII